MADEVRSLRAVELYELLSAPLTAMIQADALAARATLDFIQAAGFIAPEAGEKPAGEGLPAGRLRMAEFRYKKLDENNQLAEFVAAVPVLSLVPIPSLQIKQAKVKLAAKITDVVEQKPPPGAAPAERVPLLAARPLRVMARPAAASGARGQEVRASYDLEIEISLAQADVALGMEKILALMDRAIQDAKAP
jgi:hypothetical protein